MMIYINTDFKCHTVAGDGMTAVETTAFDGKCVAYIEGYRFVPAGEDLDGSGRHGVFRRNDYSLEALGGAGHRPTCL